MEIVRTVYVLASVVAVAFLMAEDAAVVQTVPAEPEDEPSEFNESEQRIFEPEVSAEEAEGTSASPMPPALLEAEAPTPQVPSSAARTDDDTNDEDIRAATKISSIYRGHRQRRKIEHGMAVGATERSFVADAGECDSAAGGESPGALQTNLPLDATDPELDYGEYDVGEEEEDEYDVADEDDVGFQGGEGYGDYDMLEAAEVDADEEKTEEERANMAELFRQAQARESLRQPVWRSLRKAAIIE